MFLQHQRAKSTRLAESALACLLALCIHSPDGESCERELTVCTQIRSTKGLRLQCLACKVWMCLSVVLMLCICGGPTLWPIPVHLHYALTSCEHPRLAGSFSPRTYCTTPGVLSMAISHLT